MPSTLLVMVGSPEGRKPELIGQAVGWHNTKNARARTPSRRRLHAPKISSLVGRPIERGPHCASLAALG
jgi:hypothetical protein